MTLLLFSKRLLALSLLSVVACNDYSLTLRVGTTPDCKLHFPAQHGLGEVFFNGGGGEIGTITSDDMESFPATVINVECGQNQWQYQVKPYCLTACLSWPCNSSVTKEIQQLRVTMTGAGVGSFECRLEDGDKRVGAS